MALQQFLIVLLFSSLTPVATSFQTGAATLAIQSHFFTLMQQSLSGEAMSRWASTGGNAPPYCNYTGISCDDRGYVVALDVSSWALDGTFPPDVCAYLPALRTLHLDHNHLRGGFPRGVVNCSSLEVLDVSCCGLIGELPDLSSMRSLRVLDASNNMFTGAFPAASLANLTNLSSINFNMNPSFDVWRLPEEFTSLSRLQVLILSTSSLRGEIPLWIGNMTSLVDLELCGNNLVGQIPRTIGKLANLRLLELYYNQLEGSIPEEFGNLTRLTDLDISVNRLTGGIPEKICTLPHLHTLQLYNNCLTGELPAAIANSTTLSILSIYQNFLTGQVPPNLGASSELTVLELSENRFSGRLPPDACARGKLTYLLVLQNLFSGELPQSYGKCEPMLRFRVSFNRMSGAIPEGLLGLPHVSILDLSFNSFEGRIARTIGNAKNLSNLFLQNNEISGALPPEISRATNLVKIDISNNRLSGPIPYELGRLTKLNQLALQGNRLVSSIPRSLTALKSLNVLNLSNNLLTGEIPESLCGLLPNSLDFSNNQLSGPVPIPLIREGLTESFSGNPGLCLPARFGSLGLTLAPCPRPIVRKSLNNIWFIGASAVLATVGALLLIKRWFSKKKLPVEREGASLSSSSFSYDITSFHKLSFGQQEIIEALVDKNIVGEGGSGTVYRIELSNGDWVAVKKLWTRKTKEPSLGRLFLDRELKAEVETLGSIRHKNIVKLYCCFSGSDSNLLVYEYMPNGNLWNALHKEWNFLDWPTRYRIALGVARGIAYLHHDLLLPIIHRDIKTSNILLDAEFEPKVADFGIAKVLQTRGEKDLSTTNIAGTYGYLAPEYAYSSKATTKCDVYSFGVVLMELVTGRKPTDVEFGENRDLVHWVSSRAPTKEGAAEVLDKRLSRGPFRDEMIQVLRLALRCTRSVPALRPPMNEVAQLLAEVDPCKPAACGPHGKLKEPPPPARNPE
ncbi:hypothetical protein Taro_001366 [Colocasia esculenta]|uniref:Protein kinase domain-containing protein n=1 Tax=Colocasia esculenta TaxID=4460 RepID=A0A843TFZ4_COLES|nr:hypothetical protein [Colocasia esculenta]